MKFPTIEYPETPNGKRSVHRNRYGNIVGYVSGKRFWEFGYNLSDEKDAEHWKKGLSLKEAFETH